MILSYQPGGGTAESIIMQCAAIRHKKIMPRETETFSTSEAARITHVPHRTIDYWARTQLVVPSIADANGIGTDRLYNFKDLVALRVARELRQAGTSTQGIRRVIEHLRAHGWPDPLTQCRLVAVGSEVCFVRSCKQLENVLNRPGQGVFAFMLDFKETVAEVTRDVRALRAA
jgi:DNA-binding transcriptional MerR regulator